MARFRTLGKWLTTSDAVLGVGEKVVKTLVWALGGGTIATGLLGTVIAAITNNLLYGLVAGVVGGMLVLGGFTLRAIGIAASGTRTTSRAESEDAVAQDSAPRSSDWRLWQELKRVEHENEQLRVALQQAGETAGRLQDWIDTITPFVQRMQLRFVLQTIWRMGNNLLERQQPDTAAMEKWASLTSALIRKYLDDETANFFLVHDGDNSFAGRLHRLEQIFGKPVDTGGKLQSDFGADAMAEALESYPSEWNSKFGN